MDYSKIPRQDGLDYDQNNPSGQEDNQPGKTSVFMKKVKAKAKKIKNAMKKKDGNVDQDNNQNDDETVEGHEEEEVYYDDETVEDSQVHDSVPIPEKRDSLFSPSAGTFGTPGSESAGNFVHGEGAAHTGQRPKISMETPTCMEEDPPAPKDEPEVSTYGAESKSKSKEAPKLYTGSQDQFSPEPIPPQSTINPNDTKDVPLDNATKLPSNQSGYVEKLSYGTTAIANQGIAAKNVIASKLGYGGNKDQTAASDTLSTRKQGGEGEEGENQKPVGIVTESKEVREQLGSDGDSNREMTETESKIAGNVSSPGKGMVESVKDSVTSWFSGGGDQKQASEASPGNTHGEEATTGYENGLGERRLQESGN